jgi:hypothetical protein
MSSHAAQRTPTFPPRKYAVPMGVRIAEGLDEQRDPAALERTPILAIALSKVDQHLAIVEHRCETITEKVALGTYMCSENAALLRQSLKAAERIVAALSFAVRKASDRDASILAEHHDSEQRVIREPGPVINDKDFNSFTEGSFFASDAPAAPCEVCGFAVVLGMPHEVVSGAPVHTDCASAVDGGAGV